MTEKKRVRVAIGAALYGVGELIFETDGRREMSVFKYSEEWLDKPGAFALAPSLPLSEQPFYSSGDRTNQRGALPSPFSDAAPDSWGRGIVRKALGTRPTSWNFS